jgi:restriction system protein
MSNISRRRTGELQRGVFRILMDQPDGLPAKEIISRMPQVVPPTDFEKSDYPKHPGIQRYGKMIRFATIGPVKAGWLVKEKGRWYLTEEGKKAYVKFEDAEAFRRESSRLYYWIEHYDKISEPDKRLLPLGPIYYLSPTE